MPTRDISISEFGPHVARLINQAFNAAIKLVDEKPIMFSPYGPHSKPTHAEASHAHEVLITAVKDQCIYYGATNLIADALRNLAEDMEIWIGGRDEFQSEEAAIVDYRERYGVDASEKSRTILRCIARSLCPQAEIGTVSKIERDTDAKKLRRCIAAIDRATRSGRATPVDYGQFNVGITVDGVLYDFPSDHPAIIAISKVLKTYL